MDLLNLQSDPAKFREALLIDTDSGLRPFGEVMDPWQRDDFAALDPGWLRAVLGAKHKATYQRGWLERPRGHSKTADLAIMCSWALFASRRRLSGYGCAGDRDQARLLRDSIGRLVFVNPWLSKVLEVESFRVINRVTESSLEILSSDAPTSYGLLGDFFVLDELTNWAKRDLWDSIFSSAAKRSTAMMVIISNAGMSDDWTWELREAVRKDEHWLFSRLSGPEASWISRDLLDEQERLLPTIAYRRLWLNEWTAGGGDALTKEIIDAAFRPELRPLTQAQPGFQYVAGIDLGVSRDASAVCVLGVMRGKEGKGLIRLAHTRVWRPVRGRKINLTEVEDALVALHQRFHFEQLCYDPWQATHMAQRLQALDMGRMSSGFKPYTVPGQGRKVSLPMVEIPSTQKHLQAQATCCIEAFNDRRIELYEDAGDLRRDLTRMRVEERPQGFRMAFPHDALGHGDLGTAFLLALLVSSELAGKRIITAGPIPQGNAYDRFARQCERRERELEKLRQGGAEDNPWIKIARLSGRAGLRTENPEIITLE